MNKVRTNKYEGQALAIAMVILVVSSLIGLSIYSRSMKDKSLTLEERASAEALEVADVILDKLTQYPINRVIQAIEALDGVDSIDIQEGVVLEESESSAQLTSLMGGLGALEGGADLSALLNPLCPVSLSGNVYQVTLQEADKGTHYEVRSGHVWSLPVKDILGPAGEECKLYLEFVVRGDTRAGFTVTTSYCDYDVNNQVEKCRDYEYEHITSYCFSDQQKTACNNPEADFSDQGNWVKYYPGGSDRVVIALPAEGAPTEVRIKAVGGTIGVRYELTTGCSLTGAKMYQLRATANCSGAYRVKEILIPETKWHNILFDYVLFNGEQGI